MSVPRCDVDLLKRIVAGLKKDKLKAYKAYPNRAASAIVLRFAGADGVKVARHFAESGSGKSTGLTPEALVERLELFSDAAAPSSLSILYLRRRYMEESRWSGVIAFPGGKRDKSDDKDDFACVKKWCQYSIGMPITTDFVLLGRLPDYYLYSRAQRRGLMTARFVLLHIGELTPSVNFTHHDITAVTWAPVSAFTPQNVVRSKERHHLLTYFVDENWREFVAGHVPGAMLNFPSISMPGNFGELWGFTLTTTSTLLSLAGQPRLDWPLFHSSSLVAQTLFVDPLHGYLELTGNEVVAFKRPQHRLTFFMIVSSVLVAVVYVLSLIAFVIQVFIFSMDYKSREQRRREFLEREIRPIGDIRQELVVDREADERERKAQSRAAATDRYRKELQSKLEAEAESSGTEVPTFISFSNR